MLTENSVLRKEPLQFGHLVKVALFMTLLFGAYWVFTVIDLEVILNPSQIVEYLNVLGPFGPIVFILVMAIAVVVSPIPSLPLDLAAGAAFGPFLGTTYAVLGAEIGAILSFLIARALGREVISRLLKADVVFCSKCSDHHLAGLVFLSRLLPVFSFDIVSYGAGLTNMTLKSFALATLVGMIPPTFALTYFGSSVISIQWPLILMGGLLVILFLFLPKLILHNKSARWVRLIQGETPVLKEQPSQAPILVQRPTANCPFCGEAM